MSSSLKIGSTLDLDEDEFAGTRIFDAMGGAHWDLDRVARFEWDCLAVERDPGPAFDDHPVLGALRVTLIAEAVARQHFDPLHFVRVRSVQDREAPPRFFLMFAA